MSFNGDYDAAHKDLSQALVAVTRTTGEVAAEDPAFLRLSDGNINQAVDQRTQRLLRLTEKLLKRSAISEAPRLQHLSSIETNWQTLVEAADSLLERADMALDEYKGYKRRQSPASTSVSQTPRRAAKHFRDADIPKPQLHFENPTDNFPTKPFQPLLTSKPHAKQSLRESVVQEKGNNGLQQYFHPYGPEIASYTYPDNVTRQSEPIPSDQTEGTSPTWVDTAEKLYQMLQELKQSSEIAVDLEHHDTHSYHGIVSLMQISTRHHDWIVDTLQPWRRKLEALNQVFTDPNILKVFHGSSMDMIWLQRDFGIYVVGLFDTYHAACALHFSGRGLAFLLKTYVNFDAQKQYQTADWRIRPLPVELMDYARSDTHFLLYIYDCMKNRLLQEDARDGGDRIGYVLEQSKLESLQRHEHPIYAEDATHSKAGWFSAVSRAPRLQTDAQLAVYIAVHKWRDVIARESDESTHSVMPLHVLSNIVSAMPSDLPDLMRSAQPISRFVRPRVDELLRLIRQAKSNPTISVQSVYDAIWELRPKHKTAASRAAAAINDPSQPFVGAETKQNARAEISKFWGKAVPDVKSDKVVSMVNVPPLHGWATGNLKSDITREDDVVSVARDQTEGASHQSAAVTPQKHERQEDHSANAVISRENSTSPSATNAVGDRFVKKQKTATAALQNQAQPFDYEGAPSLLNATSANKAHFKKAKHNPYMKATDTTESLKSSQYPRPGKTSVFK